MNADGTQYQVCCYSSSSSSKYSAVSFGDVHMDIHACSSVNGGRQIALVLLTFLYLWMENNSEHDCMCTGSQVAGDRKWRSP